MAAVVVGANVFPHTPAYEGGLITGVLVVIYLWMVGWLIWVPSGLSLGLNGVWAESWSSEDL